jgi:hypothetical protein
VKLVAFLLFASFHAAGCSLVSPEPFVVRRSSHSSLAPSKPLVQAAEISLISDPEGSCAGVGWVSIIIGSNKRTRNKLGYIIRAKSGVNDEDFFPVGPMRPLSLSDGEATLFWGWYGVTTNPDGHLKWDLEVIEVSANGKQSRPTEICVSTNDSCELAPASLKSLHSEK